MDLEPSITIDNNTVSLLCEICYEDYNSKVKEKRPHVMNCGHSLCYECLESIALHPRESNRTCPFDKKKLTSNNMADYPVNWAYLEMISAISQKKQEMETKHNTKDNCTKVSFPDGNYEGDIVRSKIREGQGKMTYKNGSVYEGAWVNNQRNGIGKYTYMNGDVYQGNWDNDKQNGQGIITYATINPKTQAIGYNGNWKDGKFFGIGSMLYENDISIEGVYCNNELCQSDLFKLTTKDSIIIGKYQNNNNDFQLINENQYKEINGYEIDSKGYVVKGSFRQKSNTSLFKNGDFILTKHNGDIYFLDFSAGQCKDYAEIKFINGDYYKGSIKELKMNGLGQMIFKNVGSYEGQFKNDIIDGKGKFTYDDGGVYEGDWKEGVRHGSGKYSKGKYKFDGQWAYNEKNGTGVEMIENGETYTGSFKDNVKEGEGLYIFASFDTYRGHWKDNEMDGVGKYVYCNGFEVSGTWSKGHLLTGQDSTGKTVSGKDKTCIIF